MYIIKRHHPAYFDGFEDEYYDFETTEELLYLDFVKGFTEHQNFHKFSKNDSCLMVEYNEGKNWWVVGVFRDRPADYINLPEWIPVYEEKEQEIILYKPTPNISIKKISNLEDLLNSIYKDSNN
jgi:hypothetical protein